MILGEIISRLRNSLKEIGVDTIYTNRYLWNVFQTTSSKVLKIEADNKKKLYSQDKMWQTICIEMEKVSALICNCNSLPYDCMVYRSKKRLPSFLESSMGILYKSLTTIDRSREFTLVSPSNYIDKIKNKYNKAKYAFIDDGYLYTPADHYPILSLRGLFSENISEFQCNPNGSNSVSDKLFCNPMMNLPSGVPDYLEDDIIKMSLQELFPTKNIIVDEHPNQNTIQTQASV